jgi:peptidoglycan/xylan/chitin deacetylase (PgdA/CDA1 family)
MVKAGGPARRWRGFLLAWFAALFALAASAAEPEASILVYHRFGPTVADGMTTRTVVFEAQLARLRQEGYQIVPLAEVVAGLAGKTPLPPKAVAITVDDGHRSVYTELLPIIRRERLPVTLFIYPSAISNASYAMTWEQLRELLATGLVQVQSHTYWHPNFDVEKRRLAPDTYRRFVDFQLERPRRVLKAKLGVDATYLAWPYGIHDPALEAAAAAAGYQAAFTLVARDATAADPPLALPRYLIVDAVGVDGLIARLRRGARRAVASLP